MAKKRRLDNFYAVIHAGGVGTRLWPLSRSAYPKQFLQLFGGKSLLQMTVERCLKLTSIDKIIVTTSRKYLGMVGEQIPDLPTENILAEPVGRSNLPPNIWAALSIGRGKVMGSFWSDHLIVDESKWVSVVRAAAKIAEKEDQIITLGLKPKTPHTGYGYIEFGKKLGQSYGKPYYEVVKFHEKPTEKKAERYLKSGNFLWNSGMFVWKTDVLLDAAKKYTPKVYKPMKRAVEKGRNMNRVFRRIPSIALDEGISEKADNLVVFKADFGWSDLGDWKAFYSHGNKDKKGNVKRGPVFTQDTEDSLLISENGRLLAANDIKDMVVIVNKDVVFISSKGSLNELKPLLNSMEEEGLDQHL